MLELSLAQELFLVLFSILYGVMLQSLIGLQPFPLVRTCKGYVKSDGKLKTHFKYCGEKSNKWLVSMWRKRVGVSIILLNFSPIVYLWAILELLGNRLLISLHNLLLIGIVFWSALGVFGFYRIYHAIAVWKWESLFCDVKLKGRLVSFDAWAHSIWGMLYLLPPLLILILLSCLPN